MHYAQAHHDDFRTVLAHYAIERWLHRLGAAAVHTDFHLYGQALVSAWGAVGYRLIHTADLAVAGSTDLTRLRGALAAVCQQPVERDGLTFFADSIELSVGDAGLLPQAVRVTLGAVFGSRVRLRLRLQCTYGDVHPPKPIPTTLPTLIETPAPYVQCMSRELLAAHIVHNFMRQGRDFRHMRQIYELYFMAQSFAFSGGVLSAALSQLLRHRATFVPSHSPVVLGFEFAAASVNNLAWTAFVRRAKLTKENITFGEAMRIIRRFLTPPLEALAQPRPFTQAWSPGGPWT